MRYRSEIDGLRALAVLPVVLFHAGFTLFSGGFIGVDIFFVISGYLITTILITELDEDRFSILTFYERRFRRILPALFVMILATIPLAWRQLDPHLFKDFSQSILACMVFASNILFWRETGYFDTTAEDKPLLHTWSLAVEEQYYLFFPILLLLLWRYGRRPTVGVILLLSLLSFGICLWGARHSQSANFYLLPSRMWELFAGSICAFLTPHLRGNQWLSALGVILILTGIFLIDGSMRFPDWITLVPVLGASMIILFARPGTYVARALSWKPMVGIGLMSYSLYLWHQPIFAFARLEWGHHLPILGRAALIALSLLCGFLSWRFVERPFRGKASWLPERRALFGASFAGMAGLALFGTIGIISHGALFRYPEGAALLLAGAEDHAQESCHILASDPLPENLRPECFSGTAAPSPVSFVLTGDSHAWALSDELRNLAAQKGLSSYVITHSGCAALPGIFRPLDDKPARCDTYARKVVHVVEQSGTPRVVIAARFSLLYHLERFDNGEGGVEFDDSKGKIFAVEAADGSYDNTPEHIRRQMRDDLVQMAKEAELFIVEPIPEAGWNVPATGLREMYETDKLPVLTTSYARYKERNDPVRALLREVQATAEPGRVHLIRVDDLFCNEATGRCDNIVDGAPLYFDDDHLSNTGARRVAPRIVDALEKAMRPKETNISFLR